MFGWLKRLFHPPGMLDLDLACGRIYPAKIRFFSPKDLAGCCELYRLNEPDRFPTGGLPDYEKALCTKSSVFIVIEENSEVIATGGVTVSRTPQMEFGILSYGLVHPTRQNQGLGTTLLLARLALLPDDIDGVGMFVVPKSRRFYERFGFSSRATPRVKPDGTVPLYVDVAPDLLGQCRILLSNNDAVLPSEKFAWPADTEQEQGASGSVN